LIEAIEDRLPAPDIDITVLIPYERGDLVSKIYPLGTVEHEEHSSEGTSLQAKGPAELVDELREFQRPDLVIDQWPSKSSCHRPSEPSAGRHAAVSRRWRRRSPRRWTRESICSSRPEPGRASPWPISCPRPNTSPAPAARSSCPPRPWPCRRRSSTAICRVCSRP